MQITRILTKKMTSFWLLSLAAVAFVFLLTAWVSFSQLTHRFQVQKVNELASIVEQYYISGEQQGLEPWLPASLRAYQIEYFSLFEADKLVYQFGTLDEGVSGSLFNASLVENNQLRISVVLPRAFSLFRLTLIEILILLVGVGAVALFVRYGHRWLETQLSGVEDLAVRSKLVLDDKYDQALAEKGQGRPRLINRALTHLLLELDDAQKHRARFDQFIRSNTFLDPETGIGNRLFLKNRLDALSNGQGMMAPGVMMLLEMEDLDLLQQEVGDEGISSLLEQSITEINQLLDRYANSIFSRRSFNQFAIIVPQISLKDVEKLAARLLRICHNQDLTNVPNKDNFFHIGAAYFKITDSKKQLLDEAERALRAAQFQGDTGWFMYDKGAVDEEFAKGSVRWRSFLEFALVNRRLVVFTQPVIDSDMKVEHFEVSSRIRDNQNNLIRATLYIPMAIKCGLTPQFERQVIETVLFDLLGEHDDSSTRYSINLSLDTLLSRAFIRWLKTTLLEYRDLAPRIIFEVNEDILVHNLAQLTTPLAMIKKMGSGICVDRVGQKVVSSNYIKDCHVDAIKLHRSIVRQIHLRQENQLFVRSLIGGLYRTKVKIFADSVESFEELQTLKILGVSAAQGGIFSDPQEVTF